MSNLKAKQGSAEVATLPQQPSSKQAAKLKATKLGAEKLTPEEQLKRFHDVVGSEAHGAVPKAKPAKLGAEKLSAEEQRRRFIEAARAAGASEDEADFDTALKRIAKPKASKD